MPNKKTTELVDASLPLTGGEYIPIVQSGSTVKTTTDDIADLAIGDVALKDIAAVYELNVPFKQFVGPGNITFISPAPGFVTAYQFISNSKAVIYKSDFNTGLSIQTNNYPLQQDTSLSWTIGGGLSLALFTSASSFYFSLTETPKIATYLGIGFVKISQFNFLTERIGQLGIDSLNEFLGSTLDLSSLKSCTGNIDITDNTGAFIGKTLDVSGLENWSSFGNIYINGEFANIILPTNLKTASRNIAMICFFDQPTVDAILQMFVDLDGTNGKELWQGNVSQAAVLNLTGYNASPSASGLANKAILEARNNVVINNN